MKLNLAIRQKADEIMKDPEFRDTMRRLFDGKTTDEIRGLHNPGALQGDRSSQYTFEKAQMQVKFEKRCASVTAEAILRKKDPNNEPTQEAIRNTADALLKDARFTAFVREKEDAFGAQRDYENAMKDLDIPEKRSQFISEMAKRVTEPIPQQKVPNAEHNNARIRNEDPVIQNIMN